MERLFRIHAIRRASVCTILKSVDFTAFAENVKTIAPKKYLYQSGHAIWSKHMPKINYYQKKGNPSPLAEVTDEKSRPNILKAVRATEMHMAIACIAMGIL